mmetsp:Transcript_18252/g.46064  ORF Transcript_18252/g.46064 Transcript_18252/m.46064 type:complete len:217 (+) Transcript_18252:2509-3159(+)
MHFCPPSLHCWARCLPLQTCSLPQQPQQQPWLAGWVVVEVGPAGGRQKCWSCEGAWAAPGAAAAAGSGAVAAACLAQAWACVGMAGLVGSSHTLAQACHVALGHPCSYPCSWAWGGWAWVPLEACWDPSYAGRAPCAVGCPPAACHAGCEARPVACTWTCCRGTCLVQGRAARCWALRWPAPQLHQADGQTGCGRCWMRKTQAGPAALLHSLPPAP